MQELLQYLVAGMVFGLAGGLSPGPTTTLVIAQTLRFGLREGAKIAFSPLLTDTPIIIATVVLVRSLGEIDWLLGVISLLGASFLSYLAIESFRADGSDVVLTEVAPRSLQKGIVTNFLNPHPHLFWVTIGAPTLVQAASVGVVPAVGFLVGIYGCLVGAKLLLAVLVARSRTLLASRAYRLTLRLLAVALGVLALSFLYEGLRHLGAF